MFYVLSKIAWALLRPSNFLMLGLAFGALLLVFGWQRAGTWLVVALAALLLVVGSLPVGSWLLLPLESRFPVDPPLPDQVAGVIVLGGALEPDLTAPRGVPAMNEAGERVTALLALARRLPEARIVFTGGLGEFLEEGPSEASAVPPLVRAHGLDPARVILEARSRNTYENAVFSRDLVAPAPGSCWLLVTSAFHIPRAVGVFRQVGWNVLPYPVDFRIRGEVKGLSDFNVADRLVELDLAVHSWLGMAVYALTGRSSAFFPAPEDPACPDF